MYSALADAEALEPTKECYENGLTGMEDEFARYMEAVETLERSGVPKETLAEEKAELYEQLSEINRQIRTERKKLTMCKEINGEMPKIQKEIDQVEEKRMEVNHGNQNISRKIKNGEIL